MHYDTGRAEYDRTLRQFMIGEFVFDVSTLYAHFEQLTDRRDPRGVSNCLCCQVWPACIDRSWTRIRLLEHDLDPRMCHD